jgi:hypothetical protein
MNKPIGQKTNRHLLPQEYYSSIAKIPATIWGIFDSFRGILKCVRVYSTISREAPDDILPNPGQKRDWETLLYSDCAIQFCSYTKLKRLLNKHKPCIYFQYTFSQNTTNGM